MFSVYFFVIGFRVLELVFHMLRLWMWSFGGWSYGVMESTHESPWIGVYKSDFMGGNFWHEGWLLDYESFVMHR